MDRRPRYPVWITALGVGIIQVVGSFGAAEDQPERKAIDALALLLILFGPLALARRDRWPLVAVAVAAAAADVYIALGYPYGPIFLSVIVSLFHAVQAGRGRMVWWLAGASYAGFVVATLVDPRTDPGTGKVAGLAVVAGWLAVVVSVSEAIRARRDQAAELARAEQEEEQRRAGEQRLGLAQELHDVLAHHISLINVQAGVALHLIEDRPEQAAPALANIKAASSDALRELRTALDLLRHGEEAPRAPAPRLADLDALVEGVRASGLTVHLEHVPPDTPLPAAVELAAYRIVQEALTNVARHAQAGTVTVRLDYGDGVRIDVSDDGVGGAAGAGNGIKGMKERARTLGGSLRAGPGADGGFRVVAHIPGGAS